MTARASRYRWDDLPLEKITEMVARKTIAGAGESLVQAYLKKGALVAEHRHDVDQFIYVLQGALRTTVDGVEFTLRDGDVLSIPAGVPHQAEAMDDTFVMTVTTFG